ncbi:hypothetical protein [uncultured Thiodictyon sp.]|uniref:hypothetical protein n=1 Tax=uncultured Thiodictyon sp. TaxID=1846217 RepID=UPI0025D43551|nr:hypothetical protein [uncultured Thiodictyon sp.]
MAIKELAYAAQQHLQAGTGGSFKRAHIYELLAAFFGFNSYAALTGQAVLTEYGGGAEGDGQAVGKRCAKLGFTSTIAQLVVSLLPVFIAERRIGLVPLSDLVAWLRDDCTEEYFEWREGYRNKTLSPILLDGLTDAANKGNALAHYALALLTAPDDEGDHELGSSYWYSQGLAGRVLVGVEKEWSDAYARGLEMAKAYSVHLREAARLGNEQALLDLAERFGDAAFFERSHHDVSDDPWRVAEIADRLGRPSDTRKWLTAAAETGDTEAMRRLIEEFGHADLQQCWTWLYLARLFGTDLTASEHYAIHEDGSRYNDDVGGPAFLDGRDGVKLVPLDPKQDAAARRAAEALFQQI